MHKLNAKLTSEIRGMNKSLAFYLFSVFAQLVSNAVYSIDIR